MTETSSRTGEWCVRVRVRVCVRDRVRLRLRVHVHVRACCRLGGSY